MKQFNVIKVDDKINMPAVGMVTVLDIFVSPRTQKIVYQVQDDEFNTAIVTDDELYDKSANH